MTKYINRVVLVAHVVVAGCAADSPAVATRAPSRPVPETAPVMSREAFGPMEVAWRDVVDTPQAGGHRLLLRARLDVRGVVPRPLLASLTLPAGVSLVRGSTQMVLPELPPGTTHVLEYELRYGATPQEDLVLRVDGEVPGYAYHATAPYRFGRPEPVVAPPAATGPVVRVGGVVLGPSVPLR